MAVVNVTPDSFSDGGVRFDAAAAIADGERMVADGADLLDIGGESTRPGAQPLPEDEELRRILPVITGLRSRVSVPISIDTYKAAVASRAVDAGATIVNDISALTYDSDLAAVIAQKNAAVILMHNRGRSADMYESATYAEVVGDVSAELTDRANAAIAAGIRRERIILDPGLGFAKHASQTLEALAGFRRFAALGYPLLAGPSRKSFLKVALGDVPPGERIWGTAAAVSASVLFGAHIVRVHDVREMVQVVRVTDSIMSHTS
jgi:dihydropteroate synthase